MGTVRSKFYRDEGSKGVFLYGNAGEENQEKYWLFPYIMAKTCPFFSYKASKLEVNKNKNSTARVVMWKKLNIPSVYTIEASFYGLKSGEHFSIKNLTDIGKNVCQALETCSHTLQDNKIDFFNDPSFKEFMASETTVESDSESDSILLKDNERQMEREELLISNKKVSKAIPVSSKLINQEQREVILHRNYKFMQKFHKWNSRKLPGKVLNKSIQVVPKIELVAESRKNSHSRTEEKYFLLKDPSTDFDPCRTNYYCPPLRSK